MSILNAHDNQIYCIETISRNMIATAGADKLIKIWDLVEKTKEATLVGHQATIKALKKLDD